MVDTLEQVPLLNIHCNDVVPAANPVIVLLYKVGVVTAPEPERIDQVPLPRVGELAANCTDPVLAHTV